MSRIRLSLLLISCLSLLACGAGVKEDSKAAPDWVSGESARFSAKQYLLGRGADARLDNAKDRARADLAKTFQVAVNEESSDVQRFQRQSEGAETHESQELTVSRAISTRTDALIQGIEIAEIWRDPVTQDYAVLAVLPRAQAARGLRQDIQALDEATTGHIARAREQNDPLSKVAASTQAVTAQRERAEYQRMLRVLDLTGQGVPPRWNVAELEADIATLLTRVTITPRAGGRDADSLNSALRAALADSGFRAIDSGADYVLDAVLNLDDLGKRDSWYWYAGNLEVTLRDTAGRVRGSQRWNIKESGTVASLAQRRAADKAAAILKKELRATLLSFAGG